jgi:hypothetical protein
LEDDHIATERKDLEAALKARDTTALMVNCSSISKRETADVAKIKQICFVEAPVIYLEESVADAKKNASEFPSEMRDLSCMQLSVEDAFKAIDKHPSSDPRLDKLVAEYTTLCPAQVAKIKSKIAAKRS